MCWFNRFWGGALMCWFNRFWGGALMCWFNRFWGGGSRPGSTGLWCEISWASRLFPSDRWS